MTRVGWLADDAGYIGGAELTQAEFRAAAPDDVEIVDCPAGAVERSLDRYVIQNCVSYSLEDLQVIRERPAVKYHNDVGTNLSPQARALLGEHARAVCCSPLQAKHMRLPDAELIPPPVDLDRFERAAQSANGERAGACCVASWRNPGKAPKAVARWATHNGNVDFYGDGAYAPPGCAAVPYEEMPALLARYRTFVFLPVAIEPFGRLVAEAWAAGCELVVNGLVGARHWLTEDPERLRSAAEDFWECVLNV